MNDYNINDENFINSQIYKDFIKKNPVYGYLTIRAYAANQAVPISNLKIIISTNIDNNNVIFYEGYTNMSGLIERISLPAPKLDINNLNAPNKTTYTITANYEPSNMKNIYKVNMYENVSSIQNINVVPNINMGGF